MSSKENETDIELEPLQQLEAQDRSGNESDRYRRSLYSSPPFRRYGSKPKKYQAEERKIVLENPVRRFLHSSVIHLIPLSICSVLTWLNQTQKFWFEEDKPVVNNALQFVAKLSELFIIGSISAMVLHHARRHLIGDNGLPFGLLSAAYRVSDAQLLLESGFRHSWRHGATWRLGIFILFGVFFSALVGPSVAIAFLPTAGYYRYRDAFSNSTGRLLFLNSGAFEVSVQNTFENAWPTHLSCSGSDCPQISFNGVLEWFWNRPGWYLDPRPGSDWYSSIHDDQSKFQCQEVTAFINSTGTDKASGDNQLTIPLTVAVSSAPSKTFTRAFGLLWRLFRNGDTSVGPVNKITKMRLSSSPISRVYQPVVQAACSWFGDSRNANASTPQFRANTLSYDEPERWHMKQNAVWSVPKASIENVLKKSLNESLSSQYLVEWIEAKDVDATAQFSIAALVAAPLEGLDVYTFSGQNIRNFIPCTFTAHWMPSTFVLDPQSQVPVETNWTNSIKPIVEAIRAAQDGERHNPDLPSPLEMIQIDASWMAALDVPPEGDWRTLLNTVLLENGNPNDIAYPELNSTQTHTEKVEWLMSNVSPALSAVMAFALANFGPDPIVRFLTTKENTEDALINSLLINGGVTDTSLPTDPQTGSTPLPAVYEVTVDVDRYGYASGAKTETVQFAMVVINIYFGVFGLYVMYAFKDHFRGHPYPINSWGGIQDVIALALNSKPPGELANCGAGIELKETWRQRIKVRADEDSNLQMVFKERPDLSRVKPEEMYG